MAWYKMVGGKLPKKYLYFKGNENTELTGGWSKNLYKFANSNNGTVNKAGDFISALNDSSGYSVLGTINTVDLSNHSSIKVHFSSKIANSDVGMQIGFGYGKSALNNFKGQHSGTANDYTITYDIGAWRGPGVYIGLIQGSTSSYTNGSIDYIEIV